MTDVARLHRELVARVLGGDATAPREARRAAFDNAGLDEPTRTLVEKVADRSYSVTDEDVAAARAAGFSEDQIFELMVCAAVGAADRQYNSAMAALAEATGRR
jgi:hypothetical protein